jgi:hypothetical protein
MIRVETTPVWREAKKIKGTVKKHLKGAFLNKDAALKNQIEKGILTIISEISNSYYAKSKEEFNRDLKNTKDSLSRFIANINRLLQQRPDLVQVCNMLKKQARNIERISRNPLKPLQGIVRPNADLDLFERLLIYRKANLQDFQPKSDSEMIKGCKIKGKMFYRVKLRIAGIIIQIESGFKGELFIKEAKWRFDNFIYKGTKKSHIILKVKIVDKLPKLNWTKRLFLTIHPDSNEINWGLYKKNGRYMLKTYTPEKKQCLLLNSGFDKGVVYALADKRGDLTWRLTDIIYDALQIILINHLIQKEGVFVHAIGLKDVDNKGVVFIGKTRSGKSTLARLWHKYSRATVINDDRIIIRRIKGSFFIYGSPWHGDFSDYLISKIDSAKPHNLLFIHHSKNNSLKLISGKRAFNLLYPNLFPALWDKRGLNKTIIFCQDLVGNLPSYSLGFRKDKAVIGFVRRIK